MNTGDQTQSLFSFDKGSQVEILARSGTDFQIELIRSLDDSDSQRIISMARSLPEEDRGIQLTPASIRQWFNYPKTYPVIARLQGEPIACIIGVPLEFFNKESWVKCDKHWGEGNTIYTQAEIILPRYRKQNYIAVLGKMYMNFLRKRGFEFVSGHRKKGEDSPLSPNAQRVREFENWQNSYRSFEYYRISLNP